MRELSQKRKMTSYVLKLLVIVSAAAGTFLSVHGEGSAFMGSTKAFMYFTIQSNIAIAVICAAECVFFLRGRSLGAAMAVVKFTGTVSITLTGVVFVVLLAPTLGAGAWNVHNILTHVIVPAATVVDFFAVCAGAGIRRRNVFYVIIPPLVYAIYAGIGYVRGWEFSGGYPYPYFFLNWGSPAGAFGISSELPYLGCVWWILILLVFLLLVGFCYLSIADRLGQKASGKIGS